VAACALQTFRREHDRFWILAAHPEINLLAAGHDSGMIVFKLARERPPHAVHGTTAFFISNLTLRSVDLKTGRVDTIQSLPKPGTQSPKAAVVRSISYNPAEHALLVNTDEEGGTYKLFKLPAASNGAVSGRGEVPPDCSGIAATAVFIARNRFAVWDRTSSSIHIRNLQNEITKRCTPPDTTCSTLFYAGTGMLLLQCEDKVILFDVQQRSVISELQTPPVKYIVWNSNMTQVALLSKHAIILADAKLKNNCTVHETIRVKSAAWSDAGVLVYTTLNHLKYCLPSGDSGIIRTLENPVYVVMVLGDIVHALDRDGKTAQLTVGCYMQ
jgi:coatomer subunit alpha